MKILLYSLCLILFTSCATILNKKTQNINVTTSNNVKTDITIDGVKYAAPGIINLKRSKKDSVISVENKKCNEQMLLKSEVDTVFWINILSGGTFGSTTDYATEKMWKYQDSVVIQCEV